MVSEKTTTQALPAGTHLEEFVIERVLCAGGFGMTYLARDTSLDRQVVIKENLPVQFCFRDPSSLTVAPRHTQSDEVENFRWSLENFSKEAAMLASLDHPGIVKVLRRFEAFGTAYFVMPFVEGVALDELVKQRGGKPFSEDELRGLLERVLAALGYLHERGIYHRDIKPGNILISNEGVPALIDFGSARQRLSERSMTVIESAGYTPFEQLQSRGNVGPWSDLYALGGTMCKLLTGDAPPKANDRAFDDPLIPLADRQELAECYSPEFLTSIDRALASRIADRWQNSGEWLVALGVRSNRIQIDPNRAPGSAQPKEFRGPAAKNQSPPHRMLICGLAACLVVAFLVGRLFIKTTSEQGKVAFESKLRVPELDKTEVELKSASPSLAEPSIAIQEGYSNLERLPKDKLYDLAKNGNAYAQALVGFDLVFISPDGLSEAKQAERKSEGFRWLDKSCEQGHPVGLAARGSAEVYHNRPGGESYAKKRYEEAVRAGLMMDLEKQEAIWLGFAASAYQRGRGVQENSTEAAHWGHKAAEGDNPIAMNNLGVCYDYGTGVAKDPAEAVKWYRKAAEAGEAIGMSNLGRCYEIGTGVAKNENEAVKWYRKAAEMGHAGGMANLGRCYEIGTGVAKNENEAVKWYRKAHAAGDEQMVKYAAEGLKRLGK